MIGAKQIEFIKEDLDRANMNKENNIQQNKINYKFKFLYAVGIFFIVAGHYRNASINVLFDWFLPKGSNIPLFMFCSGYFYKSSSINNIRKLQ